MTLCERCGTRLTEVQEEADEALALLREITGEVEDNGGAMDLLRLVHQSFAAVRHDPSLHDKVHWALEVLGF